jgi:hypothetical protein
MHTMFSLCWRNHCYNTIKLDAPLYVCENDQRILNPYTIPNDADADMDTEAHAKVTDKSWGKSVGELPWCICGKRNKGFAWIYERMFEVCARCGEGLATYRGTCKTVYCGGIKTCWCCATSACAPYSKTGSCATIKRIDVFSWYACV